MCIVYRCERRRKKISLEFSRKKYFVLRKPGRKYENLAYSHFAKISKKFAKYSLANSTVLYDQPCNSLIPRFFGGALIKINLQKVNIHKSKIIPSNCTEIWMSYIRIHIDPYSGVLCLGIWISIWNADSNPDPCFKRKKIRSESS